MAPDKIYINRATENILHNSTYPDIDEIIDKYTETLTYVSNNVSAEIYRDYVESRKEAARKASRAAIPNKCLMNIGSEQNRKINKKLNTRLVCRRG